MREWASDWGLPDHDRVSKDHFERLYLAAAMKAGAGGTGVFGLRLQQKYLGLLSQTLDRIYPGMSSDARRFERAFGKILYLHLSRSDKIAQAVSLVKAEQSGLWHLNADGTELERLAAAREPVYDFAAVHREVAELRRADSAWVEWFDRQKIRPYHVSYEALAHQPAETLLGICSALGMEIPEMKSARPSLAKLSDAVSREWIHRYNADWAAVGRNTDMFLS